MFEEGESSRRREMETTYDTQKNEKTGSEKIHKETIPRKIRKEKKNRHKAFFPSASINDSYRWLAKNE